MIIVDLNQIMISNLMVQLNGRNAEALSEDLVRDAEGAVQDLTNTYSSKMDDIYSVKKSDIMTV